MSREVSLADGRKQATKREREETRESTKVKVESDSPSNADFSTTKKVKRAQQSSVTP